MGPFLHNLMLVSDSNNFSKTIMRARLCIDSKSQVHFQEFHGLIFARFFLVKIDIRGSNIFYEVSDNFSSSITLSGSFTHTRKTRQPIIPSIKLNKNGA